MPAGGKKGAPTSVSTIVFDVGETLVDETRQWGWWADYLGVPRFTFFATFGAVIARGDHHRDTFRYFAPGLDVDATIAERARVGDEYAIGPDDLYPDALPCLVDLKARGYRVGIAGNQPERTEEALKACGIEADFIASSARWGVAKPSPSFFDKVVEAAGTPADEIAYVGDHPVNDVAPARRAGMVAIFLARGPWGVLHARSEAVGQAHARIGSLAELASALDGLR